MTAVEPPARVFGEWDAPITEDGVPIAVPVDRICMNCRERFQPGDNGAIMPNGFAQHRECGLRSVMGGIGHLVDHAHYCRSDHGPDAGFSYRQSALLVWQTICERRPVTRDDLERLRATHEG